MKKTVARLSLLILLAALILPVRAEEPVVLRSRIDRYEGIYATYTYDPQGHLIREELSWGTSGLARLRCPDLDLRQLRQFAKPQPKR